MKQGKCKSCDIRWTWKRELPSEYAECPICKRQLQRTTHICNAPVLPAVAMGGTLITIDRPDIEADTQRG